MNCPCRLAALCLLATQLAVATAQDAQVPLVAPTEALPAGEQQKLFRLPPGFEIELIAEEPAIQKPINMAFDASGALYVTQSTEYPFPARDGTPRDTIKRIADSNGDGVPDRVTTFADGLNIPIGVLPLTGGVVLGYGIPHIYRFEDTDGDGQADRRDALYGTFGFDDTHGMASSFTWTLDGWIHACHGFRNSSTVAGQDKSPITMHSGNTYRFRADGSHIEYYTHGQVNPFGMAVDTLGNLYTADCHSRPIYMLLRGAWYPSFGAPHDGLGYGPEMIAHSHGSTGICGAVYYDAAAFPDAYRHTLFIGNPVTGRINHDRFDVRGSTNIAVEQPDFLSCDDPWFRPVDIKLAPDGSLYVADFYNCIIGHYEVDLHHPRRDREKGRIWRIVYRGNPSRPTAAAPNLAEAPLAELVRCLGDENLVVRTTAVHQLVQRVGDTSVEAVRRAVAAGSPRERASGLWVLMRLGALTGAEIERLTHDEDRLVRVHALRALAGMNWNLLAIDSRGVLTEALKDDDATVRRVAADGLGRHPDPRSVAPLLVLWENTPSTDTHLIHTVRISLRDCLESAGDLEAVTREFRSITGRYRRLAEIALGAHRPAAGAFLLDYLRSPVADGARLPEMVQHAGQQLPAEELPQLVELALSLRTRQSLEQQTPVLRGLHRALQIRALPLPAAIRDWALDLAGRLLDGPEESAARTGIELAREFRLERLSERLAVLAGPETPARPLRPLAAEVVSQLQPARAVALLARLVEDAAEPIPARQKAAEVLGGVNTAESRQELLRLLLAAPDQVAAAIARGLAAGGEGAEALLAAVAEGRGAARLLQDAVVAERLKGARVADLEQRLATLLADLPPEEERLRKLLEARQAGFRQGQSDAVKGLAVYQKICANCHRAEGTGTKVGPDLDGIGLRGLERILEDVLLPSRNVDQAFRSTTIELTDGKVISGLVLREEGQTLVLVNEMGQEVRVPRGDIEEQRLVKLSPMPANIAEQLGDEDFRHLVGYLLSLKQPLSAK